MDSEYGGVIGRWLKVWGRGFGGVGHWGSVLELYLALAPPFTPFLCSLDAVTWSALPPHNTFPAMMDSTF
jgi:hypothetical protein